jgi:hypothetical protein
MGTQEQIDQHGDNSGTCDNVIRFSSMVEPSNRNPIQPADQALDAVAEQGVVLVDGPGGVAITLTSRAASDSARSIARAASSAETQDKSSPAKRR